MRTELLTANMMMKPTMTRRTKVDLEYDEDIGEKELRHVIIQAWKELKSRLPNDQHLSTSLF